MSAVESSFGTYNDDSIYLNKLEFGQPERMYAIPLVARGRGVAVLYADYGSKGGEVNVEALETLVRVAGLTVEVLASASAPVAQAVETSQSISKSFDEAVAEESTEEFAETEVEETKDFQYVSGDQPAEAEVTEAIENEDFSAQPISVSDDAWVEDAQEPVAEEEVFASKETNETTSWSEPTIAEEIEDKFETYQPVISESDDSAPEITDFQFSETIEEEVIQVENPSFEPVESTLLADTSLNGRAQKPEVETFEPTVSEPAPPAPIKSRLSDRNVDLPIEVGEDERRLHNDARRFARLLVSEIKLYNEQKVKEGREAQDLYERLREAIDRSRDMYDKRVQPPVAAKFDYFHYELVSSLAEGEETKLGGNYPGAAI